MKLFKMTDWKLTLDEAVWGLTPFKTLLDRDKTKEKVIANGEMLFIWYYTDIKSDFLFLPEKERVKEIKSNIGALPDKWKPDKAVMTAIDFYRKMSETTIQYLYKKSQKSAQEVADYLSNTKVLLEDRDNSGRPIYKIGDITKAQKDISQIMKNLREAEKEVIKEAKDNEGKSKGQQQFNTFEGGLTI